MTLDKNNLPSGQDLDTHNKKDLVGGQVKPDTGKDDMNKYGTSIDDVEVEDVIDVDNLTSQASRLQMPKLPTLAEINADNAAKEQDKA